MKQTTKASGKRHRTCLTLAIALCCHSWRDIVADASTPTSPAPSSPASAARTSSSPASTSPERFREETSSFLRKFESHGPTLTLTLRNPSTTTLLGGASSERKIKKLWPGGARETDRPKPPPSTVEDDGMFGLSSKLAALFHISSPAATTNGRAPPSSSDASRFADGYMLDDGEIFLDPPSETSEESSSRGLFSMRDMLGGWGSVKSTWSECVMNIHPEVRYEMKTRENDEDDNDARPFPETAPWLSAISCGMIWSPFPIYKTGYPEGYGHKLLSVPHYVRCGARLSLPRISSMVRNWRSTSRGITSTFTLSKNDPTTKRDLDLGVTYLENPYRANSGKLELLVGRSIPTLAPAKRDVDNDNNPLKTALPSDYECRRRNHLLVRFATGRQKGKTIEVSDQNPILSSIEYVKGSFRMPTPFFLRTRYNDRISVSPSFDVAEGMARCTFSGDVGSSGRTRAVLRLDAEDSSLTVVRALDDSKILAPTISLNSGKIVYDYYLNLDGIAERRRQRRTQQYITNNVGKVNSSLRMHVDPMKGILLKWTDGVRGEKSSSGGVGSCWVTECRIPLGTMGPGPIAADVRVGRRWVV